MQRGPHYPGQEPPDSACLSIYTAFSPSSDGTSISTPGRTQSRSTPRHSGHPAGVCDGRADLPPAGCSKQAWSTVGGFSYRRRCCPYSFGKRQRVLAVYLRLRTGKPPTGPRPLEVHVPLGLEVRLWVVLPLPGVARVVGGLLSFDRARRAGGSASFQPPRGSLCGHSPPIPRGIQ